MTDARPVREKPIIFSGPMVRAILEGRKSQTRRVLKPQPEIRDGNDSIWMGPPFGPNAYSGVYPDGLKVVSSVKYAPGDRLWVREAWAKDGDCPLQYRAGPHVADDALGVRWRPPIHMPRWASRITLEVTEVRVQRLQDISEEDARAEGAPCCVMCEDGSFYENKDHGSLYCGFAGLWASIHGPGSWEANPWVAAITFKLANKEPSP